MDNKTLILSVYDSGWGAKSIYVNNEHIYLEEGKPYFDIWKIYNDVALSKSFAYRVFEKYNELEHIIICDNGSIEVYHRDDFTKKEDEKYVYYGKVYHHELHLVDGKGFVFKTTSSRCDGHTMSNKDGWNKPDYYYEDDKEYSDDFDPDDDVYFSLTNNEKEMSDKTKSLLVDEAIKYYRGSCETHQMSILALEERVQDLREMKLNCFKEE